MHPRSIPPSQNGNNNNRGVNAPKIDTHSHIYPDFYGAAVIAAGWVPGPDGNAAPPADLKRRYPEQFGFFASLPLPSIPDALVEIDRALDELHADGFVMMSNAFGLYGGDPKLAPVYQKLNQRKAVIFFHPTNPCPINAPVDVSGTPRLNYVAPLMNAYQAPTLEFIFDTTRNLQDLIVTGTAAAYSELKFLIPHCGAALPSVIDRFLRIGSILRAKPGSDRPSVPYTLQNATALIQKQFWFDLAGWSMQIQIYNMRRIVGADKFLYGSDTPFTAYPLTGAGWRNCCYVAYALQQYRD